MKQIKIELFKEAFLPGDRVKGTVKLVIDKPVKARVIKLNVIGMEKTNITVGSGDSRRTYHDHNFMIKQDIILQSPMYDEDMELQPGNYEFRFEFSIPIYALPSYAGRHARISYILNAKVDVPLWFDINDFREFYVFRNRKALDILRDPVHFQSNNYFIPDDGRPSFYVELNKIGYKSGENIMGFITLRNLAAQNIRKVYIRLLGEEFAAASNHHRNSTDIVNSINIPNNVIVRGIPVQFRMPIPNNAPSSYEGIYSNYRWAVEVGLDWAYKIDVRALHPIEIIH
jgi:sporulation-control protein spo0M